MEVFILLLVVLLIVLLISPTEEDEEEIIKDNKRLNHCDVHKWVDKPSGIVVDEKEHYYLVCYNCGYLPESDNYEA